jgi:hypothetical protein
MGAGRAGLRRAVRGALGATAAAFALAAARPAEAQLHADVGVTAGAAGRHSDAVGRSIVGPAAALVGHIALLPMVRVGAYGSFETSEDGTLGSRRIAAVGLRAKVLSPWPVAPARMWAFVGGGYAALTASGSAQIPGGGHFAEVPFGIGFSWRVSRAVVLLAEAEVRGGFAFGGAYFEPSSWPAASGAPSRNEPWGGAVRFGFALDH